jgi:ligand-binding sensor domain-containing protein
MKTTQPLVLLILIIISSKVIECYAQTSDYHFEYLTEQDGLSHNMVWSILQDSEGFMWFGTLDGLNKYDGYEFTVLKPNPDDPENTLRHNIIVDIHEDRKGRLWVNTFGGGFHRVNKHTGQAIRFEIEPLNTGYWNTLGSIYEDQEGILWISAAGGVARFQPTTQQFTI